MSKLENKRRRAASKGVLVEKMRENKLSDGRGVTVWQSIIYRPYTHIYVYDIISNDGNYMVVRPDDIKPLAGLTYRQAVQLAYMLAFRRKGF
jgi:hypothetical protein